MLLLQRGWVLGYTLAGGHIPSPLSPQEIRDEEVVLVPQQRMRKPSAKARGG